MRYYSRVHYYFILTCHYGLLHNIIAYKQLQHTATYFSSKVFVLARQLQSKHVWFESYTVSLQNNIQNFNRLLAWPGLFLAYIEMDMNTSGMGALVISVYKKIWCSIIRGCNTINIITRNKDKTLWIVPQCGTIRGCSTNRVNMVCFVVEKFVNWVTYM